MKSRPPACELSLAGALLPRTAMPDAVPELSDIALGARLIIMGGHFSGRTRGIRAQRGGSAAGCSGIMRRLPMRAALGAGESTFRGYF